MKLVQIIPGLFAIFLCLVSTETLANTLNSSDAEKLNGLEVSGAKIEDSLSDIISSMPESEYHPSGTCIEALAHGLNSVESSLSTIVWLTSNSAYMRHEDDEKITNSSIIDSSKILELAIIQSRKRINEAEGLCSNNYLVINKANEIMNYLNHVEAIISSVKKRAMKNTI